MLFAFKLCPDRYGIQTSKTAVKSFECYLGSQRKIFISQKNVIFLVQVFKSFPLEAMDIHLHGSIGKVMSNTYGACINFSKIDDMRLEIFKSYVCPKSSKH